MRYIYGLLLLVPVAFVLEFVTHGPDILIFTVSALALIPLAAVLGKATEELAIHFGPRIGGLLNATLGNAAELIITIVALREGLIDLVKASIIGSIIGNILIVLGLSLLLGGLKNGIQRFDRSEAGLVGALLLLSVIAIAVPTLFAESLEGQGQVVALSDEVGFVMILMYLAYLAYSFLGPQRRESAAAVHVGSGEGVAVAAAVGHGGAGVASGHGGQSASVTGHAEGHGEAHVAEWSLTRALIVLAISTVGIVFMSEFLVGAVAEFTERLNLTEFFLGIIIIPIVGNVAEHIVGVQVAIKNQMDLSLGISLGSSLQIALFVAPVLLFVSQFVGEQPMDLVFNPFELIALIATTIVGVIVSLDGESNWLEGALLIGVYLILGIAFYNLPDAALH